MSEAFGNVFTEAQAMALPVVAYRHGGIVESMRNGETGLLAEENDIDNLARHMQRFLSDESFWQSCSRTAAKWVREQFDVQRQTEKLEAIYDRILRQPGAQCQTPC